MSDRNDQFPLSLRSPPELLAPAGDETCLSAALDSGADAVYFGVTSFNMRARAGNFVPEDLPRIVSRCRKRGVRSYLTLNTIVYEKELGILDDVLDKASDAGVDAIICWDDAVIAGARERGLDVHLSTQASVSNSRSIAARFRKDGIRRFVLARECSLDDISSIRAHLRDDLGTQSESVELELFIHGAMCVSVSGRCFLSEAVSGDSANRGACLQPCRRKYRIIDVEGEYEYEMGQDYVMSPKDLCTMPFLERILESGAACLKIEGRMRNPEYVSIVTSSYRRAMDFWLEHIARKEGRAWPDGAENYKRAEFEELKRDLTERMRTVFNRDFSAGFYMGRPVGDWTGRPDSQAVKRKESVGIVVNYFAQKKVAEILIQSACIGEKDELLIQGPTSGNVELSAESLRVDGVPAQRGEKGMSVTVEVPRRVRRNDAVFRRFKVSERPERR